MKTKFLIIITVIIIILSITFFLFLDKDKQASKPPISPVIITTASPTSQTEFSVQSIFPPKLLEIATATPATLTFNQPVDMTSLKYSTNPEVQTVAEPIPNGISFSPKINWPLDQLVTITITNLRSTSGSMLTVPYKFQLKTPLPSANL